MSDDALVTSSTVVVAVDVAKNDEADRLHAAKGACAEPFVRCDLALTGGELVEYGFGVLHRVASMERETLGSLSVAERGRMRRVMADRVARRGH